VIAHVALHGLAATAIVAVLIFLTRWLAAHDVVALIEAWAAE
jgi:hypothetical protein